MLNGPILAQTKPIKTHNLTGPLPSQSVITLIVFRGSYELSLRDMSVKPELAHKFFLWTCSEPLGNKSETIAKPVQNAKKHGQIL